MSLDELVDWLVPYYYPPIRRPIHFLQLVVHSWPVVYRTVVPYTWHLHYINYLPSLDFMYMYTEHSGCTSETEELKWGSKQLDIFAYASGEGIGGRLTCS